MGKKPHIINTLSGPLVRFGGVKRYTKKKIIQAKFILFVLAHVYCVMGCVLRRRYVSYLYKQNVQYCVTSDSHRATSKPISIRSIINTNEMGVFLASWNFLSAMHFSFDQLFRDLIIRRCITSALSLFFNDAHRCTLYNNIVR